MFRNDELSKNCEYARYGIEKVYTDYPYGGLNRSDALDYIKKEILCLQLALMIKFRNASNSGKIIEMMEAFNNLQGGFCGELAHITKAEINKRFPNANVEIVRLDKHELLVIGIQDNSIRNNYKTWGENAIFCDPWAKKIYRALQFLEVRENCPNIEFFEIDEKNKFHEVESHYLSGEPKLLSKEDDDFPIDLFALKNKK